MNEPQTISTGAGVRWEAPLLEASLDEAVAAWRDSLHGFAKRLEPLERVRFLMAFESAIYPFMGEAAIAAEGIPTANGIFGADMDVSLVNQGPVTIWLDTDNL